MDELSLRRALYTNPQQQDPITTSAIDTDPTLSQLRSDLQRLDANIQQTLQISVPSDLSQKLMTISNSPTTASRTPSRSGWLIAASISLLTIGLWVWQVPSASNVGEQALAHVHHEPGALVSSEPVSFGALNTLLDDLHARWQNQQVKVTYARTCHFDGMDSLHLVVMVDGKPVTLFVLPPKHSLKASPRFADQRFFGESLQMAGRDIVLIAEQADLLPKVQQLLMDSIQFTS